MYYKNCSHTSKTFYGVTFNPGEVKSVPGSIIDKSMIRVKDYKPTRTKPAQKKVETVKVEKAAEEAVTSEE